MSLLEQHFGSWPMPLAPAAQLLVGSQSDSNEWYDLSKWFAFFACSLAKRASHSHRARLQLLGSSVHWMLFV
jgi:hypothetical protein